MFCQQCGAEIRAGAGFCAVCGAAAPKPRLHVEPAESGKQGRDTRSDSAGLGRAPASAAPASAPPAASRSSSRLIPTKAQPSYDAIRQASAYRGGARPLPPPASLEVRAVPSLAPAPDPAAPIAAPTNGAADGHVHVQPGVQNGTAPPLPAAAHGLAAPQAAPVVTGQPVVIMAASQAPFPSPLTQQSLNGYHPIGYIAPDGALTRLDGATPVSSYTSQLLGASRGIHLPQDVPNRVALGALAGMFLSFFLPWVIIGGSRATPLSVGWPVLIPLALILATLLTVALPDYTLYIRLLLALPLCLGCFALGGALLLFLLSSAMAANTVGSSFLGVDIGFAFFVVAALVLTCAGYYKLIRELPLLLSGRLRLAPLPGALRALSERAALTNTPASAAGQPPAAQPGVANPGVAAPLDQTN